MLPYEKAAISPQAGEED